MKPIANLIKAASRVAVAVGGLLAFGCSGAAPDSSLGGDDKIGTATQAIAFQLGSALGSSVVTSDTCGAVDEHTPTCAPSTASDHSYIWVAPTSGSFTFTTAGSAYDTVLQILDPRSGISLCNDDSGGLTSSLTTELSAGQEITIVVDGYGSSCGTFSLNISVSSPANAIPQSGLHLWLRADAGVLSDSGSVPASGGKIAQWLDQSGNGRNARMASVPRQPSIVDGALGGKPVVRFSGSQSMYLDVFAQPTQFSVFIVGKNSLPSESYSMILGPGGNSPNNQLRWNNGSEALFVTGNGQTVRTSPVGNTRAYHALSATYGGSTMNFYRDGSFTSAATFSVSAPWTIASVGSWYSSHFMVGDLAEVVLYDRVLSEPERTSVNSYLSAKYGLP